MNHNALGVWGEKYAERRLKNLSAVVSARIEHKLYAGDVKAVLETGEIKRIEVKTARLGIDGHFRFTLVKTGHTAHKWADYVLCLCVYDESLVIPFVIPTSACGTVRAIAISRDVVKYAGKWAAYRQNWSVIQ